MFSIGVNAQIRVYHEIGGSIGPSMINGDWGRSSSAGLLFGFSGAEVNFIHNMQIIRQRMGIRNNLGFNFVSHSHKKEEWISGGEAGDSEENKRFAAMKATTFMVSLGSQFEYNFFDFGMYYPRNVWTPYVGAGFNILYYMPSVTTSYGNGDIEDENNIPNIYKDGGIINESGLTLSLKMAFGLKFKITRFITVFGEYTFQRSFSDKIDGLNPSVSNSTDYINGMNFGVTYVLY